MALSYNEYTADGVLQTFTCKDYLDPSHLYVSVNGVVLGAAGYTVGAGNQVTLNEIPSEGSIIRIGRATSQQNRLTNYEDASLLTADAMDADANQLFFMAQEAIDTASETNVAANTFYSSTIEAPAAAKIGDLWYDPTSKYLKIFNGTIWDRATPSNETLTYDTFDNTTEVGYSFITVAGLNADVFVFLNGIKQIKAPSKANLLASQDVKDYWIDIPNSRIYFAPLAPNSVVEVVLAAADVAGRRSSDVEAFITTPNQQIFNLNNSYIPSTNSINVYVAGIRRTDYVETDANTITFSGPLNAGLEVVFIVNQYETVQGTIPATLVEFTTAGGANEDLQDALTTTNSDLDSAISTFDTAITTLQTSVGALNTAVSTKAEVAGVTTQTFKVAPPTADTQAIRRDTYATATTGGTLKASFSNGVLTLSAS